MEGSSRTRSFESTMQGTYEFTEPNMGLYQVPCVYDRAISLFSWDSWIWEQVCHDSCAYCWDSLNSSWVAVSNFNIKVFDSSYYKKRGWAWEYQSQGILNLKLLMPEMTAVSEDQPHLIQYYMSVYHASSVPLRGEHGGLHSAVSSRWYGSTAALCRALEFLKEWLLRFGFLNFIVLKFWSNQKL